MKRDATLTQTRCSFILGWYKDKQSSSKKVVVSDKLNELDAFFRNYGTCSNESHSAETLNKSPSDKVEVSIVSFVYTACCF